MCTSSLQPFPAQEIHLLCLFSILLYSLFHKDSTEPGLLSPRAAFGERQRKGDKREGERTLQVVGTATASGHGAFSAGTQLLSCHRGPAFHQNIPPLFAPLLNHKRGEQAWTGIIGSFLSAPAMCKDSNNGRDREGK